MDINAEIGSYLVMRDFEDASWADAEKAKIHRMAATAVEVFKEPPDPMQALFDAMRNAPYQPGQQAFLQAQQAYYQQGTYPTLGSFMDGLLGNNYNLDPFAASRRLMPLRLLRALGSLSSPR